MTGQQDAINELKESNENITSQLNAQAAALEALEKQPSKKKQASKGGSNEHAASKPIIHPLFCDLCGIDRAASKKTRVRLLALSVKKLEDGALYEALEDGREVWHPDWLGKVDDDINAKFIAEVTKCVWNNEKSQRANRMRGGIPDEDYDIGTITECVKCYFRTIHARAMAYQNPTKAKEADEKLVAGRQRARHATVSCQGSPSRCINWLEERAAGPGDGDELENNKDVIFTMIQTEFGSDILSYESDELSDDTRKRRKDADVGRLANMAVGHEWRSVDYTAFLRFLSLHAMKIQVQVDKQGPATKTTSASSDIVEPPKKRRKTQVKKLHKRVFDATPRNMSEDPPSSWKGTPFSTMVSEKWKKEHPDMKIHAKGGEWLEGFFKRLKAGDVFAEDAVYLAELDTWHKPAHEVASIDEEENHV
ncbi:hypothetical protein PAXINDRAFT_11828 [Paxillus involutus ATCC 200175]|uniref:Uncharacterized protein n=1 Tax=Paxillus involutus ATCC 200175 TaxID=664439 RepID=A0A0C9THY5_PAXIN|nr:hypothetical protein PAXINDRAFT_11828 [Paxillus involutus ATCC 200175]